MLDQQRTPIDPRWLDRVQPTRGVGVRAGGLGESEFHAGQMEGGASHPGAERRRTSNVDFSLPRMVEDLSAPADRRSP